MSQDAAVLLEDELFAELKRLLKSQDRDEGDIQRVELAYYYAREKHTGQIRKNNDNYITHPVQVATILAKIPVDPNTIMAGLLHDVLEDTDATEEEVSRRFGEDVLNIVEGVTKLGKFQYSAVEEDRQAENFRRMFIAMAKDLRVILVKLADRLHNMRTLQYMAPHKQVKIASETMEIFAPLANLMGMGNVRAELEDLSLRYLDPDQYREIEAELAHTQEERAFTINEVTTRLNEQLHSLQIQPKIYGRVKNYYSIYKKLKAQQKQVHEIYDISALRVIVETEKDCYEALGAVHHSYKPIPGRFKDYIAMPKRNFYQSLHTTVIGPKGRPLEVQIRTGEMHRIAEYGIAAHWRYKESGSTESRSDDDLKLSWLKQMLEMRDDADDAREYVDSVKLDLFRDEVFVFTPKGKVIDLPRGSTPVDFAYKIHTAVGNACSGSMVNGKIVPLDYKLGNGDIVEIITNAKAVPRLDWIKFVQTQQAKSRIRYWYKKNHHEKHELQGRQMLEGELGKTEFEESLKSGKLLAIAKELNYASLEDLYLAVGFGELTLARVTNRLKKQEQAEQLAPRLRRLPLAKDATGKGEITELRGMLYNLAKCCSPVPGEAIIGVVTRSRGVMVHRDDCINLDHVNADRIMYLTWGGSPTAQKTHEVRLEAQVIDRMGVFKDILTEVAGCNTNLTNAKVKINEDKTATIEIAVEVQNLEHLETVKKAIMKVSDVISVKRQLFRPSSQSREKNGEGDGASDDDRD